MRIAIDARKISDTGIGRYIENLINNLLLIDKENEYFLFHGAGRISIIMIFLCDAVTKVEERAGKYSIWEHWSLARKSAQTWASSCFHAPHYVLPIGMRCRSVVTIHDLSYILLDPSFGWLARGYANLMIRWAIFEGQR